MPPKRKVSSNKKKKKLGRQTSTAKKGENVPKERMKESLLPTANFDFPPPDDANIGSYYQEYKKVGEKVKECFRSLVPSSFRLTTVNDLARAANYIHETSKHVTSFLNSCTQKYIYVCIDDYLDIIKALSKAEQESLLEKFDHILIPKHLLQEIRTTISLRSQVMNRYRNEGADDDGHSHFINVLEYCEFELKASRRITKRIRQIVTNIRWTIKNKFNEENTGTITSVKQKQQNIGEDEEDQANISNRFAALVNFDDDGTEFESESDDDESDKVQKAISDPISEETEKYNIDDLIKGSDRLHACSFLYTIEQLMGIVAMHYQQLKSDVSATKCSDPKQLMQCAMVANTCMYSVQRAEAALINDHPHLSSIYGVLAIVFLPNILTLFEMEHLSSVSNKVRNKCDKKTLVKFLGDIVQCSFHNKGDKVRFEELKTIFCKKTGLTKQQVHTLSYGAKLFTDFEISSFGIEKEMNKDWFQEIRATGVNMENHSWFKHNYYIGGSRPILNTLRMVQTISETTYCMGNTKLISKPGFFGALWDENNNPARSIQGDMDELFGGSILPELLAWCKTTETTLCGGIGPSQLLDLIFPYTEQTLPILHSLRKHMKGKRTDPVPAHLVFGMHCLLTSIIELQGNGDVARHALNAERSWNHLFDKLEPHTRESDIPNHDTFFRNVSQFRSLRCLSTIVGQPSSSISPQIALFNPLMAGSYLLFANYVIGIGLGSHSIDSIGQLRFVMHIYNALQKNDLVKDIPLLREVDIVFKDTKALWVLKDKPGNGEFCKRFLIAWGFTPQAATKAIKEMSSSKTSDMSIRPQNDCRNLDPILPEDMSASYRLIMNRDFKGLVDDYSVKNYTPEERKANESFLTTITNVNMTRDQMDDDEDNIVCFTNWTEVGCILNNFVRELMKELKWDSFVQKMIWKCPDSVRHGQRMNGARAKGKFGVSDTNLEYQAYSQIISSQILHAIDRDPNCKVGKDCADFMTKYFSKIDRMSYSFLIEDMDITNHEKSTLFLEEKSQFTSSEELMAMSVNKLKKMALNFDIDISRCLEKREIVKCIESCKKNP